MKLKSRLKSWLAIVCSLYFFFIISKLKLNLQTIKDKLVVSPKYYAYDDPVELIVNNVQSDISQVPFGYYDLPFICPPTNIKKPLHLSLSEILKGDRKWESDYILKFNRDEDCVRLCDRKTTPSALKEANELIKKDYIVQWLVDGELPASTTFISTIDHKRYYASGFPLGFMDPDTGKTYINNHVMIVIRYNTLDVDRHTIVGLEIYPKSVSDYHCPGASKDYSHYELNLEETEITYIPFTYSVYWREEFNVDWYHRWDFFINNGDITEYDGNKSHFRWVSFIHGIIISLVIALICVMILTRCEKDNTNKVVASEWINESSPYLRSLNILVSMGIQFLFVILGYLIISCSMNKYHYISDSMLFLTLIFFISGSFVSSFLGVFINGNMSKSWCFIILCGCLLPGFTLLVVLILNTIIWIKDSSHTLPFGTIVMVGFGYLLLCIPTSIISGITALKFIDNPRLKNRDLQCFLTNFKYDLEIDNRYYLYNSKNSVSLPIWLKNPIVLTLSFGFIPFATIYVELLFIYRSLWVENVSFYYLYGFLVANMFILLVVITGISIIGCYIHIIYGNDITTNLSSKKNLTCWDKFTLLFHSWRWKCFQMGGSLACYLELYSLYYLFRILRVTDISSILLFASYTTLFNILCWCCFGSLSYMTCSWFVNRLNLKNKVT